MSLSVTNFDDYSVKKIVQFEGMEGAGFNCDLYRGTKKVAFCRDNGNGGDVTVRWSDKTEEELLLTHVASLPPIPFDYGGGLKKDLKIDEGWFVSDLVAKRGMEKELKKLRKKCEKATLYRIPNKHRTNEYTEWPVIYSDKARASIVAKYPDAEIFNDVLAKGQIPSVLMEY